MQKRTWENALGLTSSFLDTRLDALARVLGQWQGSEIYWGMVKDFLAAADGDSQEAKELLDAVSDRLTKRIVNGPLDHVDNLDGYLWFTARSVKMDYLRRKWRKLPIEAYPTIGSTVLDYDRRLERQQAHRQIVENIIRFNQKDEHRLILLLSLAGCTRAQIAMLLPVARKTVYRVLTQNKFLLVSDSPPFPVAGHNDWGQKLAYTGRRDNIGLSYLNSMPSNLAPDTVKMLCKLFSLNSITQLPEIYLPALMIHFIQSEAPQIFVSFLKRDNISWKIPLERVPLQYVEFRPVFERVRSKGHKTEKMVLVDQVEYSAQMLNHIYADSQEWIGALWLFDRPEGKLKVHKAVDTHLQHFYEHPASRVNASIVFQPAIGD